MDKTKASKSYGMKENPMHINKTNFRPWSTGIEHQNPATGTNPFSHLGDNWPSNKQIPRNEVNKKNKKKQSFQFSQAPTKNKS